MKIVHVLNSAAIEKKTAVQNASFFISNNAGGFGHFAASCTSKYQGMFNKFGSDLFRTVECIGPLENEGVAAVENLGHSAIIHHSTFYESFFMPQGRNCLVYQLSRELPAELFLDIRRANDFRQWGRNYKVYEKEAIVVAEFVKKTDGREDGSSGKEEFSIFVAAKHDGSLARVNAEWIKRNYSSDAQRNSASERHVYKAVTITARTLAIAAAKTAAGAIREAELVFKNIDKLKSASKAHYNALCQAGSKLRKESKLLSMANDAAAIALDKLRTSSGLYAGLPWFFQEWSRDELVSCVALPATARRQVVLKYLDRILDDGRLPEVVESNNSNSSNSNADSIGWLFKRASDLIDEDKLTAAELKKVKSGLKESIDKLLKSHLKNGFIANDKNETWMDTDFKGDSRKGVCVEIQAMQLNMYRLMYKFTKEKTYLLLENSLRQNVRKFFWNGSVLADRLNDYTIRPNIFIAAYIYPQLLSKEEWETCVQSALGKLWLDWGGLATIDKSHRNFRSEYTGETNESYHRGDSWFWINNIAAIVMSNINRVKFKNYIQKIVAASINDILWKGAIGCGSELSSAKEQRAEGCLNQAWSNATFIELIRLLKH